MTLLTALHTLLISHFILSNDNHQTCHNVHVWHTSHITSNLENMWLPVQNCDRLLCVVDKSIFRFLFLLLECLYRWFLIITKILNFASSFGTPCKLSSFSFCPYRAPIAFIITSGHVYEKNTAFYVQCVSAVSVKECYEKYYEILNGQGGGKLLFEMFPLANLHTDSEQE